MQKIVIHSPGGYEKLQIETHPDLAPKGDEVLVETTGIGVNYADCCVRWGVYESAKEYVGWPITPGFEFSGKVVALGPQASRFQIGDAVFGITRFNAYATQVAITERNVFKLPAGLNPLQAAAFPAVFLTAYHALFQAVQVRSGMTLLVHSAAGGVGSALVQLGRIAGCKVIAVVGSSHKVEYARELGADVVIDKSREDLWKAAEAASPTGYDIILDANGYPTLAEGYRHLRPTGRLVTYGFHTMLPRQGGRINYLKAAWGLLRTPKFNPMDLVTHNKGVVGFNLSFLFERAELIQEGITALMAWMEAGKLRPPRVTSFPMAEVARAHQTIESGKSTGKLVLVP